MEQSSFELPLHGTTGGFENGDIVVTAVPLKSFDDFRDVEILSLSSPSYSPPTDDDDDDDVIEVFPQEVIDDVETGRRSGIATREQHSTSDAGSSNVEAGVCEVGKRSRIRPEGFGEESEGKRDDRADIEFFEERNSVTIEPNPSVDRDRKGRNGETSVGKTDSLIERLEHLDLFEDERKRSSGAPRSATDEEESGVELSGDDGRQEPKPTAGPSFDARIQAVDPGPDQQLWLARGPIGGISVDFTRPDDNGSGGWGVPAWNDPYDHMHGLAEFQTLRGDGHHVGHRLDVTVEAARKKDTLEADDGFAQPFKFRRGMPVESDERESSGNVPPFFELEDFDFPLLDPDELQTILGTETFEDDPLAVGETVFWPPEDFPGIDPWPIIGEAHTENHPVGQPSTDCGPASNAFSKSVLAVNPRVAGKSPAMENPLVPVSRVETIGPFVTHSSFHPQTYPDTVPAKWIAFPPPANTDAFAGHSGRLIGEIVSGDGHGFGSPFYSNASMTDVHPSPAKSPSGDSGFNSDLERSSVSSVHGSPIRVEEPPIQVPAAVSASPPHLPPKAKEHLLNERRCLAKASSVVARLTKDQLVKVDSDQDTLLHLAVAKNERYLVEALVNRFDRDQLTEKAINLKNKQGQTPLCLATVTNQHQIVRLLIARNGDVNGRIPLGAQRTGSSFCLPVHFAASNGREWLQTLGELLQARNVDLTAFDSEGFSALHKAVMAHGMSLFYGRTCERIDSKESVRLLVQRGAPVNQQDKIQNRTALHMALEKNDLDLFYFVVDLARQRVPLPQLLNARSGRRGDTLLHVAAGLQIGVRDQHALIHHLIGLGADARLRNYDNRLPFEIPTRPEVAEFLKCAAA